ncbi:MAG: regulatory iron-sulfur-containing complex subunit RicT [Desulfobacterales bacterium]
MIFFRFKEIPKPRPGLWNTAISASKELNLRMNLFKTETNFDASKSSFFTADGRGIFKLVKMLVKEFRPNYDAAGIREPGQMCGGVGWCGRELCCSAFMTVVDPVSIRMAKKQDYP